ncbi:MAG: hypothetical protein AAB738_03490 [Patescibacteria group bacterium]
MGELIRIPHSDLHSTIEVLDHGGVHPVDFDLIRSNRRFAAGVIDFVAFGNFRPTQDQRAVRRVFGSPRVWFPGDWGRLFMPFTGEIPDEVEEIPISDAQLVELGMQDDLFLFWTPKLNLELLESSVGLKVPGRRLRLSIEHFPGWEQEIQGWYLLRTASVVGSEGKRFSDQLKLSRGGETSPAPVAVFLAFLLYYLKNDVRLRVNCSLRMSVLGGSYNPALVGWRRNCVGVDQGLTVASCSPDYRDSRVGLATMIKL